LIELYLSAKEDMDIPRNVGERSEKEQKVILQISLVG